VKGLDERPAGGRLYVVATPIGNLADVTLRALDVLRAVPLVAAEDTRVTRRLFVRHGIGTRLVSYHARNAATRAPELLTHLRSGADLAIVTDAGTPGVSDPGAELVKAWAAEGGEVVAVPGPSAVMAAVSASGLAGPRWAFEGFLPRSGRVRRDRLARLAADDRGAVLFEAANRTAVTLSALAAACGEDRRAAVCRELTKVHEEIIRGRLGELARRAAAGELTLRGEVVLVLGPREPRADAASSAAGAPTPDRLKMARADVERLAASGVARGEAARRVSAATGIPRRALYGSAADRGRGG
jgi:16S rRNA (cytidine1402-2'-O)-methyltransferase